MKNSETQLAVLLLSTLCFWTSAYGQVRRGTPPAFAQSSQRP
jgi:hypothetical protein